MARCDVCRRRLPAETEGICPECLNQETEVKYWTDEHGRRFPAKKRKGPIPWRKEWN